MSGWLCVGFGLLAVQPANAVSVGKWQVLRLDFAGPNRTEMDSNPNPFLDYRLAVTLTSPSGKRYAVPGYFAGDGRGGGSGTVWRVTFTPPEEGEWNYVVSFRQGEEVNVSSSATAGSPTSFDGQTGSFTVTDLPPNAAGFFRTGWLEYVDTHYLKFRDGGYFIKGGTDSPENFLAYSGFDATHQGATPLHTYAAHRRDWDPGDPNWTSDSGNDAKGIVGAINYLGEQNVNSIYFMLMNIGGDGQDTWPYAGPIDRGGNPGGNDHRHFDISKLYQWGQLFEHAQRKGVALHMVLGEGETNNKMELGLSLSTDRKLFYKEMVARFGYLPAIQWNISEEFDAGGGVSLQPDLVKEFAGFIQSVDPLQHPVTVHNSKGSRDVWEPFVGDDRFSVTSFQYGSAAAESSYDLAGYGEEVRYWREHTAAAGRPLPINMDELRLTAPGNTKEIRRFITWPTYMAGGNVEFYSDQDTTQEEFYSRYKLWNETAFARKFMLDNLPFWEMEPANYLAHRDDGNNWSTRDAPKILAKPRQVYAVYLPLTGIRNYIDLSEAGGKTFSLKWFNPRNGKFEGGTETITASDKVFLTAPGSNDWRDEVDWVALITDGSYQSSSSLDVTHNTEPVYTAKTISVEIESVPATGEWRKETDYAGYGGSGYYSWRGANQFENKSYQPLEYTVNAPQEGLYRLQLYNYHIHPDVTEENDAWIQVNSSQAYKTFSHRTNQWLWSDELEIFGDIKGAPLFYLYQGENAVTVAPRSANFSIDAFRLIREEPEQPVLTSYAYGQPPPPAPPPPPSTTAKKGDANDDGVVDGLDYVILFKAWGSVKGEPRYDARANLNANDNKINVLDYVVLFEHWGVSYMAWSN